jgi:hypothetical protein
LPEKRFKKKCLEVVSEKFVPESNKLIDACISVLVNWLPWVAD